MKGVIRGNNPGLAKLALLSQREVLFRCPSSQKEEPSVGVRSIRRY